MSRGRYLVLAGLLGLLPMLLPLSVDGSLALLPDIAAYFATDIGSVQLTLTAVVLGIAVGQLFYGPVSDRFGRKPVIISGIACYALAGIGCANAPSIEWLIFFRFLQGFFACSGIIVARAVIRDMFDREAGARLFALMMGIHGIMPTLAPGVSGWMTQSFGWQSVFWVMVGFAVFTGISVWLGLPETSKSRIVSATRPAELLANYRTVFRNRAFLSYATCACFMYGALMAYFAGAPVGFIKYLGLVPLEFGIAMAVPMVTYVVAQIAVARLAPRIGLDLMIRIGVFFAAIAGIGMLAFVQLDMINIYTLIGPVVLVLGSLAFITPSTTAGALSPFAEMAGAASSLLGFIQFLAAAAATALVGLLNDGTPGPMVAVIFVCCLCSLIAYLVLVLPLRRVDRADD